MLIRITDFSCAKRTNKLLCSPGQQCEGSFFHRQIVPTTPALRPTIGADTHVHRHVRHRTRISANARTLRHLNLEQVAAPSCPIAEFHFFKIHNTRSDHKCAHSLSLLISATPANTKLEGPSLAFPGPADPANVSSRQVTAL